MEEQNLADGQKVWVEVDRRRAIFLYSHPSGAAIVRFEGERQTRVVPSRNLRLRPGDRRGSPGRGATRPPAGRDEPPTAA